MNTHEWPLVIFTVLVQSSIGAYIWCFLAQLIAGEKINTTLRAKLNCSMLLIWGLMLVALLLSTFHLGSPFRAINSLFRVGRAPLSNEIFCVGAFFGLGVIGWLVNFKWPEKGGLSQIIGWLTLLAAVVLLFAVAAVYRIPTVPMWDSMATQLGFIATALICGSALAALLMAHAAFPEHCFLRVGPLVAAAIGVLIAVMVCMLQLVDLQSLPQAPLRDLTALVHSCMTMWIIRFVLFGVALLLWGLAVRRCANCRSGLALVFVLLLIAEMIGRLVFYSLNMTVGLI